MIILLSGGLDSAVLAGSLAGLTPRPAALSFDYGQRHGRELASAAAVAEHYRMRHDIIDLSALGGHLGSALTGAGEIPDGHYSAPSMAATVVPGRNAIMLAVAAGIAASRGARRVAVAVHAGDHPVYPDCRPEFISAMSAALRLGTAGHGDVTIHAPFAETTKAGIVMLGAALSVPMGLSWSCYRGGDAHCGRCGTCVERWGAFRDAKVPDPTSYQDPGFAAATLGELVEHGPCA